ncbi:hypothetical protein [Corallibacter sp.]|uniref:hypothetical protein n=1 Tax=Corallibacter sp. TaxID=2038084 RepID=UPI003A8EF148
MELTARINSLIRRSEDYEHKTEENLYTFLGVEVNDTKNPLQEVVLSSLLRLQNINYYFFF